MKTILLFSVLFLTFTGAVFSSFHPVMQDRQKEAKADTTAINPVYDPALAKKLGADDFGMKSFVLVILKTGDQHDYRPHFCVRMFPGHLDNINRLVKEGKLVVTEPFGEGKTAGSRPLCGTDPLLCRFSPAGEGGTHDHGRKRSLRQIQPVQPPLFAGWE